MTIVITKVYCGQCSRQLSELPSRPIAKRTPCPACGSTARGFKPEIYESITASEGIRLLWKYTHDGRRKYTEMITGWFASVRYGIVRKFRLADRRNDLYQEKIWTKDGTLVHETEEPLSKHFGHGSDKPKR
jgi:hypothetical protein